MDIVGYSWIVAITETRVMVFIKQTKTRYCLASTVDAEQAAVHLPALVRARASRASLEHAAARTHIPGSKLQS